MNCTMSTSLPTLRVDKFPLRAVPLFYDSVPEEWITHIMGELLLRRCGRVLRPLATSTFHLRPPEGSFTRTLVSVLLPGSSGF